MTPPSATPPATPTPSSASAVSSRRSQSSGSDPAAATAPATPTAAVTGATDSPHGYIGNKDDYLARLRRIEGQARGLQRMVEQDTYCIDILTQVAAMTKALQAVSLGLLDDHLRHCVVEAVAEGGAAADAKLTEASAAIGRLVRS